MYLSICIFFIYTYICMYLSVYLFFAYSFFAFSWLCWIEVVISFISLLASRPVRRINSLARLFVRSQDLYWFHFLKHTSLITSVSFGVNEVKLSIQSLVHSTTSSRARQWQGFFFIFPRRLEVMWAWWRNSQRCCQRSRRFSQHIGVDPGKNPWKNGDDMRDFFFFSEALRIRVNFCLLWWKWKECLEV